MQTAEEEAKARRKEMHRRSMILTGAVTVAAALAAAWIGFAPLPRLGGKSPEPAEPKSADMKVRWRQFSPETLAQARKLDRLILLSLHARWAKPSRLMDAGAWSDERVAAFAERELMAVRVDADLRPDLALRYLGAGWPTTSLLLPTGEVLSDGTFMDADTFLRWAETIAGKFRARRAAVFEAAADAAQARARKRQKPAGADALEEARRSLQATWAGPALFSRFDRLLALSRLKAPWAPALSRAGREAALSLQDADGGFFRARGPDGTPAAEKRLGDQADALAFLSAADPEAAARLRRFVSERLALPDGGYRASVWPGGSDDRVFCDESARMAAAVLRDPASGPAEKAHAQATVRMLVQSSAGGLARRGAGLGPVGLLGDQLGLLEALDGAAAQPLLKAVDRALLDEQGRAYFDRLPTGELPADLDRVRFAGLNARAWRLLRKRGDKTRAAALAGWLWENPQGLDAGDLAELAEERAAATGR